MKERDKLVEETIFSDERVVNTRIQSCLRRRFGYGWRTEFPTTLGEVADLGKWEFFYMPKLGKKSREAVFKTLEEHGLYFKPDSKLFLRNEHMELELLTRLKRKGLAALGKCPADFFEDDCKAMGIIDDCFYNYLDYLEEMRTLKLPPSKRPLELDVPNKDLIEIYNQTVQSKRAEYDEIVERRRSLRENREYKEYSLSEKYEKELLREDKKYVSREKL